MQSSNAVAVTRDWIRSRTEELANRLELSDDQVMSNIFDTVIRSIAAGKCPDPEIICRFALEHVSGAVESRPQQTAQKTPKAPVIARKRR